MQYKILIAKSTNELEQYVALHLGQGWKLQGGVAVTSATGPNGTDVAFFQAVVK